MRFKCRPESLTATLRKLLVKFSLVIYFPCKIVLIYQEYGDFACRSHSDITRQRGQINTIGLGLLRTRNSGKFYTVCVIILHGFFVCTACRFEPGTSCMRDHGLIHWAMTASFVYLLLIIIISFLLNLYSSIAPIQSQTAYPQNNMSTSKEASQREPVSSSPSALLWLNVLCPIEVPVLGLHSGWGYWVYRKLTTGVDEDVEKTKTKLDESKW